MGSRFDISVVANDSIESQKYISSAIDEISRIERLISSWDENSQTTQINNAAGLEPVKVLSEYKWQDGLGYYESTKDASTNFFFDYLPKGNFIFEYDLRVNHAGNMSTGITTIQSMYAPEFSSHSEGTRILVK